VLTLVSLSSVPTRPIFSFCILSAQVVSEDVPDFEYSPTEEFRGPFSVVNLPNEEAVVRHFLAHCQSARPSIYVTYNGDFFDWPFLDARAAAYGISLRLEAGGEKTDDANAVVVKTTSVAPQG
jgi:DNA polymerase epsilon subunit 1